jgi:hypothetical protein
LEIRNLDKMLVYRICEELTQGEHCDPMPAARLYRSFADLPTEKVKAGIQALVENGWLRWDESETHIHLTARGRSEIRDFIPEPLRPTCDPPEDCLS